MSNSSSNVIPLLRRGPKDLWLDELEDGLRTLLEGLPCPSRRRLPPEARAWRAVARVLMTRELGANQFGSSYREPLWTAVEGYAEGRVSRRKAPRGPPARRSSRQRAATEREAAAVIVAQRGAAGASGGRLTFVFSHWSSDSLMLPPPPVGAAPVEVVRRTLEIREVASAPPFP